MIHGLTQNDNVITVITLLPLILHETLLHAQSLTYELERKIDWKARCQRTNGASTKGRKGYNSTTHLLHVCICVPATSTNGQLIGGTQINTLRYCRESQPSPGTRSMRIYCLWTCIATSMAPRGFTLPDRFHLAMMSRMTSD